MWSILIKSVLSHSKAGKHFTRCKNSNVIHVQRYAQDTIRIVYSQVFRKKKQKQKHHPPVIITSECGDRVIPSVSWLAEIATLDNSVFH